MSTHRRKRGQREGTIRQRKDGRWEGRVALGWDGGKRKFAYFYGARRKDVAPQITKALHDRDQGLPVVTGRHTVESLLAHWLEHVIKPSERAARTFQGYELLVRRHIVPGIGNIPLRRLTADDLDRLFAAKLTSGMARATIKLIRVVMKSALAFAMKRGYVAQNVAVLTESIRARRPEGIGAVPDAAQIQALLDAATGLPQEALYVLAVTTGARKGELMALRWADVDFDTGHISIQHSSQRIPGRGIVTTTTKTPKSRRVLPLAPASIAALKKHRSAQALARLKAGPLWVSSDLIFATKRGKPVDPTSFFRGWKNLLLKAGLPSATRFHDLRYGAASYLFNSGTPMRVISDLLGHSNLQTTSDLYTHLAPKLLEDAAAVMERLIK